MKNLFDEAMNGIGEKVAMQEIRKVIRGKDAEKAKLDKIISIVLTYLDYSEQQELNAERRAIETEGREKSAEDFEDFLGVKESLDKLTIRKGEEK